MPCFDISCVCNRLQGKHEAFDDHRRHRQLVTQRASGSKASSSAGSRPNHWPCCCAPYVALILAKPGSALLPSSTTRRRPTRRRPTSTYSTPPTSRRPAGSRCPCRSSTPPRSRPTSRPPPVAALVVDRSMLTVRLRCTCGAFTMHLRCTYDAHAMHLRCTSVHRCAPLCTACTTGGGPVYLPYFVGLRTCIYNGRGRGRWMRAALCGSVASSLAAPSRARTRRARPS